MNQLKPIILGALAATAALAAAPRTAEAALENKTAAWCKQKTAEDQTVVAGGSASLIFKANGDLVLQPLNHLVAKIWSSGTAGSGEQVCWGSDGALSVRDAAGATLWSKSGGSVPDPGSTTFQYRLAPKLAGCDLSARYTVYRSVSLPWGTVKLTVGVGDLWTREATCPEISESVVGDDWCFDASADRQILQSGSARLVWKQSGDLQLLGTGLAEGKLLWWVPTFGAGKQICFHPNGRLAITNAAGQAVWQTSAGSTLTSHLLELDECSLRISRADGSATMFSSARRCPQTTVKQGTEVHAGSADVVLAENDLARLAFQPDGNLVLRTRNGDEVWHSALPPSMGKRVTFQADGNLVIYHHHPLMGSTAVWSSGTYNQGVDALELEGCGFAIKAAGQTRYARGFATCPSATLTNTPAWSIPASGRLTILRTPESRLVWQQDGNLVLYTTAGVASWSSDTDGTGKALAFQHDGNLVVYRTTGTPTPADSRWSSGTWVTGGASHAVRLGDHCKLTITDASGASTKWLGNDACLIASYTHERMDGDGKLGAGMRTHMTAKYSGTGRIESQTAIDVAIFGERVELFSGGGSQSEGDTGLDPGNASVTILGESAMALNFVYEQTFFERSQTFNVGPVPVFVEIGASGELALGASYADGTLTLTPSAGIYATVAAGVGGGNDLAGARAGIRGSVTLIELALPVGLKLFSEGGVTKFRVTGDLELSTLSGSLELFAEAYVKICWVKVSADWSKKLFSWKGFERSWKLFDKTAAFN